jgi:hypothetical protein
MAPTDPAARAVRAEAARAGAWIPTDTRLSLPVYSVHDTVVNLDASELTSLAPVAYRDPSDRAQGDARRPDRLHGRARLPIIISVVTRPGDMSDLAAGVPRLPHGLERGQTVALDTRAAERWDGSLETVLARARPPKISFDTAVARLRELLEQQSSPESFRGLVTGRDENPFVAKARRTLAESLAAAPAGSAPDTSPPLTALLRIVGLGVGFTPSGDDFLAGALLGHALAARLTGVGDAEAGGTAAERARAQSPAEESPAPDPHDEAVHHALARTTPGGCTLLWLALHGRFPSYLLELARAIAAVVSRGPQPPEQTRRATPELQALREAALRAFGHGETSGQDAVTGLVASLGKYQAAC